MMDAIILDRVNRDAAIHGCTPYKEHATTVVFRELP
jgi:hypothetical protein